MNLNQGKRTKQAVQVLNKVEYDSEGNPIGMMEDPSNPASANFGTPREPRRGGCYKGDGSAYIEIIGLLSTDTVEVFDGSDIPTISNDRLDIASGNRIFGVKIYRAGELWAKYNCSENSGTICYDSSGNGNHGTIVNAITTTPEENPNSIHQYQDVYSFENEEGYSRSIVNSNIFFTIPTVSTGDILEFSIATKDTQAVLIGLLGKYTLAFSDGATGLIYQNIAWDIYIDNILIDLLTTTRDNLHTILADGAEHKIKIIATSSISNLRVFNYEQSLWLYTGYSSDVVHTSADGSLISRYVIPLTPKNSSITLPPFKDVLGNNLQYVGRVPGKAKFVNSSCFLSDGNAYLSVDVLTTDTITAHPELEVPVCTTDGRLDFSVVGGKYYDITIERGGSVIARLPLCEPIIDPSNHTYHDVSGNGNHATLINGTLANEGKQDKFHYMQRGFNIGKFVSANSENWDNNATGWSNYSSSCIYSVSNNILTIESSPGADLGQFIFNSSIFPVGKTYRIYFRARCVNSNEATIRVFCGLSPKSKIVSNEFSEYVIEGVISGLPRAHIQVSPGEVFEVDYIRYYIGDTLVPVKYNGEGFPDGGYIESGISQDHHSFLNTGTELEAYDYPALRQADKDDDFWNEGDGLGTVTPKPVQFDSLIAQKGLSDKLFLDSSVSETIKNIRMYGSDLKGRQLNTENKLTNN